MKTTKGKLRRLIKEEVQRFERQVEASPTKVNEHLFRVACQGFLKEANGDVDTALLNLIEQAEKLLRK